MTKVSVLIITYNQENYIQDCINSVLNQSLQDFEIIINDDCSTDNTVNKIKEIQDNRIKLINPKYNQGINAAINNAFNCANGEYIVLLGGDDMLKQNHLQKMIETLENNSEIDTVYCNVSVIDENNNPRNDLGQNYLKTDNLSTVEQLYQAFMYGNFVTSPGMMIRKNALQNIMPLPYSIVNNQDFKIHIELLVNGSENIVLEDKLVLYRQPHNKANISARSFVTELRESLEFENVMDAFLKINDINLLENVFANEILKTGIKPYPDTIPFFLGYMAIYAKKDGKKSWGYHKIIQFLQSKENFDLVKDKYNFEFKDLLQLTKEFKNTTFHRCFKYKKGFNFFLIAFIITFIVSLITSLLLVFD